MPRLRSIGLTVGKDVPEDGWQEAASFLLSLKLRSLSVKCPRCGRTALPLTRWVPGRSEKPFYAVHSDHGGPPEYYRLSKEETEQVRGKVELSRSDLKRLLAKAHGYVLFSGGVDSLCLLLFLLKTIPDARDKLTALHIDTTTGFPEVGRYVRRVCRKLELPLKVVCPSRDFFELAKTWGIPGFSARWCCKELKVKPVRDFLAKVLGPKIVLDGIRAEESYLRSTYLPVWYHPTFKCLSVSPILGWSDEKVRAYVDASGLPKSPVADLGCSSECWCGAYKKRKDFEALLQIHPEIFDKLVEVEKAQKGRYTFLYEKGEQVPLTALKSEACRNGRKPRS